MASIQQIVALFEEFKARIEKLEERVFGADMQKDKVPDAPKKNAPKE